MKILIGGDLFINDSFKNKTLFDNSVMDLFQNADYRIINLEAPITPNAPEYKILKTGPHLRMSEDSVMPFLKQLKVDAVTLANNHILDYGANGLKDTFASLKKNQIEYVGAGINLEDAARILTLEKDGMRIAILNFCENEWSIAGTDNHGANPLNIIDNVNQIKEAKSTHDKVICIIHGGHEYYHLPSPRMVKQYRFYVDNGADAIVGHHTHCISGYEVYKNAPIIYSLGNFVFTEKSLNEEWYVGFVMELSVIVEEIKFEIHPVKQKIENNKLFLSNSQEKEQVITQIQTLNDIIVNDEKLYEHWIKHINKQTKIYLDYWSPLSFISNKYIRAALRKLKIDLTNKNGLSLFLNLIRCETHNETSVNVLTKKLKD